ncbi:hypothetical protein ACFFLS_24620 [Flavobacterium procerum]|uniref:DUF2946 domain-containing protein n=1 Tax=Flavobacterium procerum TaxID=1455569 RepID=A0ABV6BZU3_9FLAO
MPLVVVFAILFPVIHSYEHIQAHDSSHKITKQYHSGKTEFKKHSHSNEECAICHFKFSPVGTFTFVSFSFYKAVAISSKICYYFKSSSSFFKGSLFALRAPPTV